MILYNFWLNNKALTSCRETPASSHKLLVFIIALPARCDSSQDF